MAPVSPTSPVASSNYQTTPPISSKAFAVAKRVQNIGKPSTPSPTLGNLAVAKATKAASTAKSLLDDVEVGHSEGLLQKAAILLVLGEKEIPRDPLLVVQHLIDAISSNKAIGLDLEAKKGLAKALHRYVDLTVVHLTESDKKMFGPLKENFHQSIDGMLSLLEDNDLKENGLRFHLESAKAGLNSIPDTTPMMVNYLTEIVGISTSRNLGGAIQLLESAITEVRRSHASSWYVNLLLLRLQESVVFQSEDYFSQLMAPVAQGSDWQLFYGAAQAHTLIIEKGTSPSLQQQALDELGKMASFSKFTFTNNWRVRSAAIEGLIYLSAHSNPGVQERVEYMLLDLKTEEKDLRVLQHFDQKGETLELKKKWYDLLKKAADQTKDEVSPVERLARKKLKNAPIVKSSQKDSPLSLIEKHVEVGNFEVAWHNLLILISDFFETAKESDAISLYKLLKKLVPHLVLDDKDDLFNKILPPLEESGFLPREGLQLKLTIAKWLTTGCKKMVKRNDRTEKIYIPALEMYGRAVNLAKKLEQDEVLTEIYKGGSKLLATLIFEQLDSEINLALDHQDQKALETLLRKLASAKETFCADEEDQKRLISLHMIMLPFFSQHPVSDKLFSQLLLEGQQVQETFERPYLERCHQALKGWKTTFASQKLLTAFPALLENGNKGWTKRCELFLTLLGESVGTSLLAQHIRKESPLSLSEFAIQKAALAESEEEVEQFLPLIEGAANHLLGNMAPGNEHEKLYKILSAKTVLEPLRERYLQSIPQGTLFDKLALIPNRNGFRQKMRIEEETLKAQIEAITQSTPTPIRLASPLFAEPRYLKQELISTLLDDKGNVKKQYADSAHRVSRLQYNTVDLHLKQKPSHPMEEYAVYNLVTRLSGKGVPPSTLVRFDVELSGQKKSYPVLISKTVLGKSLKEVLANEPNKTFDLEQITHQFLLGLLTRPGDGRASNFIVTDQGELICIDNDVSFVEPVVKKLGGYSVNFTSILYCLATTPLSPSVLEEWSRLSPDLLFADWINDLVERETNYVALFSEEERRKLYEEEPDLQFTPQLLSKAGLITTLYTQLHLLQKLHKNPPADGLDLLKHLIVLQNDNLGTNVIGPLLHRSYEKCQSKATPSERLKGVTNKSGASITTPQALHAALGRVPTIQEIEKREEFSLEKLREEFLAFSILREQSVSLIRQNGLEALEVDFSKITKEGKPDLERQKLMLKGLQLLFTYHEKPPQKITLVHCAALTAEKLLPFLHKGLIHLDVRGSSLQSVPSEIANCPLKELYLTGCEKLTSLDLKTARQRKPLTLPNLEILHINNCPQLASIQLEATSLQEVKASGNPKLTNVTLRANLLTSIELKGSPQISLEQIFSNSYPEFRVSLDEEFCKQLGGDVYCLLENQSSHQKKQPLGQGLLSVLKRSLKGADFEKRTLTDTFKFSNITMGIKEAKAIASVLDKTSIPTLDLGSNYIGDDGVEAIASVLDKASITTLNLRVNGIGNSGAKAIAAVLDKTSITSLNLERNSIGPDGAIAIAAVLDKTSITSLNLGGNYIGSDEAKAIAAVLDKTSITSLNLEYNSIGPDGTKAIASVLDKTSITSLDLGYNGIDTDGAKAIAAVLDKTSITALNLESNSIDKQRKAMANLKNRNGERIAILVRW